MILGYSKSKNLGGIQPIITQNNEIAYNERFKICSWNTSYICKDIFPSYYNGYKIYKNFSANHHHPSSTYIIDVDFVHCVVVVYYELSSECW